MKISQIYIILAGNILTAVIVYYLAKNGRENITTSTTTIHRDTTTIVTNYPTRYITQNFHIDSSKVIIPDVIDTAAIIARFFTAKNYAQTINENDVEISITDSICMNSLLNRKISVKNNRETRIETILPAPPMQSFVFYGGIRAGYIQKGQSPVMVQPVIGIDYKRKWKLDAGYDLLNNAAVFGIYRKF